MNVDTLFAHLPVAVIVGWVAAVGIPYVSALATKRPGWWTGTLTLVLSLADGFLTEWAHAGDAFAWKAALGPFVLAWATATLYHSKVLKGSVLEAQLHAVGSTGPRPGPLQEPGA